MRDQILFYAAGALDAQEAEEVRRHLARGCPRCAGEVAAAEATLALTSLTLPRESPSVGAAARLMNRVGSAQSSQQTTTFRPPWWAWLAVPSAIAAAVAASVTIFFAFRLQRPPPSNNDELGVLTAMVATQQQQLTTMRTELASQQDAVKSETNRTVAWAVDPDLKTLWLTGTNNQPADARGRIFWDTDRGVWHFYCCGLKPPAAGKTYELWFVSSDGKTAMPAGSFDPSPTGEAAMQTSVPQSIAPRLTIAAVTDEPAGTNITSPTGSFQLKGSMP